VLETRLASCGRDAAGEEALHAFEVYIASSLARFASEKKGGAVRGVLRARIIVESSAGYKPLPSLL
jgi:hypothetical protein